MLLTYFSSVIFNRNNQILYCTIPCFVVETKDAKIFPSIAMAISVVTQISYMLLFYKNLKMHKELNKNAANAISQSK